MKLYNKQLNSIEELRREKQKLKADLQSAYTQGLFSLDDLLPGNSTSNSKADNNAEGVDIAGIATSLLSSLGGKNTLLSVGLPLLKVAGNQLEKGVVKKILKEVGLGYIKWKAIELSVKGIKHMVDKKVQERAKNR
jgi:hypothetical protein